MSAVVETWEVAGAAYLGGVPRRDERRTMRSHAVEVNADGEPTRVLGGSCVRLDSLTTGGVPREERRAIAPTCVRCMRAVKKLRGKEGP